MARDLDLERNTRILILALTDLGKKLNFQLFCFPGGSLHLDMEIKRNSASKNTL